MAYVDDQIAITVLDDGPGLAATLHATLKPVHGYLSDSPAELIDDALRGRLGRWHRARGMGLPAVWQAAQTCGGQVDVATLRTRVTVGARGSADDEGGAALLGTCVRVTLSTLREARLRRTK